MILLEACVSVTIVILHPFIHDPYLSVTRNDSELLENNEELYR